VKKNFYNLNNKIKLKDGFSLRFTISTSIVGIVIITSLFLSLITLFIMSSYILNSLKKELAITLHSAVISIDAETHKNIKNKNDENLENFKQIYNYLIKYRKINIDIYYIYTLRMNEKGKIYFVVDATDDIKNRSHVGDIIDNPPDGMLKAFSGKYEIFVDEKIYTDKWGTWLTGYAPFYDKNKNFEGVLAIDISVAKIRQYQFYNLIIIVIVTLIVTIISVIISIILSKRITKPLVIITDDMLNIQKFKINSDLTLKSKIFEIRKIIIALGNMKKSLRSFKKYVPAEIVSELVVENKEAILGAEKKQISIFFSDIENFTKISEQIKPELLSKVLGFYLSSLTKVILKSNGIVDKFIGDSIMAIWGAPKEIKNHQLNACLAAIACIKINKKINIKLKELNIPEFNTRIGINSGEAIIGNMGYSERLSYTAIGDNVNLASRLESLNKYYKTNILISESVYEQVKDVIQTRFIDLVAVKGKNKEIKIYEVIDKISNLSDTTIKYIELYEKGMKFYLSREWQKAIDIFTELPIIADLFSHPSEIISKRCREYLITPPPDDWHGITYMRDK